jgi:hypothetical protein
MGLTEQEILRGALVDWVCAMTIVGAGSFILLCLI